MATLCHEPAATGGAAVSPDFAKIAICDAEGHVRVLPLGLDADTDPASVHWLERTASAEFELRLPPRSYAHVMQWTGDGDFLVTWGEQRSHWASDFPPQIWTADGKLVWTGPNACDATVHPTSRRIAFVRANEVQIGWLGDGFETIDLPGAYGVIEYDPRGERLAVGGTSRKIEADAIGPSSRIGEGHPRLRILDGEKGTLKFDIDATAVTLMGIKTWVHRLRWSPDGRHIAVSAGKGHHPGVFSADDGSLVLKVPCGNGQMWRTFAVGWAGNDLFLPSAWLDRIVPLANPNAAAQGLECWGAEGLALVGTRDVVLLLNDGPARIDPTTGKIIWQR